MEIFSTLKVSLPYLFLQDKADRHLPPQPLISTSRLPVAGDSARGDPGAPGPACSAPSYTETLLGLSLGHTLKQAMLQKKNVQVLISEENHQI